MDPELIIHEDPTGSVEYAILEPLVRFNAQNGFPADARPVALEFIDDDGSLMGGLWGRTVYDWLSVDYLVVAEPFRGRNLGTRLLVAAEAIAKDRGCVGSWLTTLTFQAQAFYEKLGYETFGRLDNSPRENVRVFLRKRLD